MRYQLSHPGLDNLATLFFYLDHLILHLELHCLSFMMWGAAVLVEWLSPGHLYLMLQTVMGYQL